MNQKLQLKILLFTAGILLVSLVGVDTFASNNTQKIYLTGKITDTVYGTPVVNHKIFVISESVNSRNASYNKVLITDEEGFYYDTLTTGLNKGSFQVYTYDGNNDIREKKIYFRFIELERSSNIFVADFSIYMPYLPDNLQANFNYVQKNEDNHFNYQFVDQTTNENVNSWHWDFGDGNESREQNPEHTFPTSGLFKIILHVIAEINGQQQVSSISRYIYVSERSYYHLGGHCFAGYFPIDKGKAYLFYIDEMDKFIPIDTSSFDTLGYYYFYEIPEGEYCIKVQPESTSEFYGKMMPTYFGNEVFWEMATHISHHQTNWEYDIHLIEGAEAGPGLCSVSGNIAYGDTITNSIILPAEGIDFYLLDEQGALLSSHYSDDNGNFSFETIENGVYSLTADVPGYKRKNKLIELNDDNPNVSNIEITIENGDINMGVENVMVSMNNSLGKLYPNPASDNVKLEIEAVSKGLWSFEIYNTLGKIIQTQTFKLERGNSIVNLNTSTLISGQYILLIKNAGNTTGKTLIVNK